MKVKVKTLQGKHFEIETQLDEKVLEVKQKIEAVNGFDANCQRLIYNGKLMENDASVGSYNIKEGAFIVSMVVSKPAQSSSSNVVGSGSVDGDQENDENAGESMQINAHHDEEVEDEESDGEEDQEPTEEAITALTDMGFPRDNAIQALRMTGSVAQSAEILASGVPLDNIVDLIGFHHGEVDDDDEEHSMDSDMQMNFDPSTSNVSGSNPLAFLQSHPLFEQIRSLIRQDPSTLPSLLENLRESDPELYQLIADNRDAVNELLYSDQASGAANTGSVGLEGYALTMTPEDHEAVTRLEGLGFNRNAVVEAYFTCDKNEEMAANYLFDHGQDKGYEELMEKAIEDSQREHSQSSGNQGQTGSTLSESNTNENKEANSEEAKQEDTGAEESGEKKEES
mmetsp:Transcript_50542/g.57958  ORF Transcript_50542/g.57958 Transcript_50542/m.57958 type:complete len:397 (+) Transcript_50542:74-1264(+)|eukprot:CAMPEP_0115029572 /NCGR_PEP_ID=MMETSP0216-20121206/37097_1 /TAXON_ID=223996 /ORGANISM="Protocruzia adherens, Strain Boccale" /LENGTH=396 /DNA_ID=CAMNT_0002406215 /DNA_START=53 /DNA_END=1243 /DNA_ORIENTATION=+